MWNWRRARALSESPRHHSKQPPIEEALDEMFGSHDELYDHVPQESNTASLSDNLSVDQPFNSLIASNLSKVIRRWLFTPLSPGKSKTLADKFPVFFENDSF